MLLMWKYGPLSADVPKEGPPIVKLMSVRGAAVAYTTLRKLTVDLITTYRASNALLRAEAEVAQYAAPLR